MALKRAGEESAHGGVALDARGRDGDAGGRGHAVPRTRHLVRDQLADGRRGDEARPSSSSFFR
eukprot:30717-Pelagococcus_subviridis.AAC.3